MACTEALNLFLDNQIKTVRVCLTHARCKRSRCVLNTRLNSETERCGTAHSYLLGSGWMMKRRSVLCVHVLRVKLSPCNVSARANGESGAVRVQSRTGLQPHPPRHTDTPCARTHTRARAHTNQSPPLITPHTATTATSIGHTASA